MTHAQELIAQALFVRAGDIRVYDFYRNWMDVPNYFRKLIFW